MNFEVNENLGDDYTIPFDQSKVGPYRERDCMIASADETDGQEYIDMRSLEAQVSFWKRSTVIRGLVRVLLSGL